MQTGKLKVSLAQSHKNRLKMVDISVLDTSKLSVLSIAEKQRMYLMKIKQSQTSLFSSTIDQTHLNCHV